MGMRWWPLQPITIVVVVSHCCAPQLFFVLEVSKRGQLVDVLHAVQQACQRRFSCLRPRPGSSSTPEGPCREAGA
jgi:hypothetical protein